MYFLILVYLLSLSPFLEANFNEECQKRFEHLQINTPNLNEYVFHSRCKTGRMLEIQKASELKYGSNSRFLETALKVAPTSGIAVDLGSGTGVWTKHLINLGVWHVHAVDFYEPSLIALKESIGADAASRLTLHNSDFRKVSFSEPVDLILANNSLSFVPKADIPAVIENIYNSLKPGGIFAATFWGDGDIRGEDPDLSTFTREEVRQLFEGKYTIISCCNSEEGIDRNLDNELVPWHVIYTIVQKPR